MTNNHRQLATIINAEETNWRGEEGGPLNTVQLTLEFEGGYQGFGGLNLAFNKNRKTYIEMLCDTFGVSSLDQLVGKKCYALRCFSTWNQHIEGLESVDTSKRFTMTNYRRREGFDAPSPLDEAIKDIQGEVTRALEVLTKADARIKAIKADYREW